MRKIRPTFLFRFVTLVIMVLLYIIVLKLVINYYLNIGLAVFLVLFWFIGIESGWLVNGIGERFIKRAQNSQGRVNCLWFVDIDQQTKIGMDIHAKETADNPTLR